MVMPRRKVRRNLGLLGIDDTSAAFDVCHRGLFVSINPLMGTLKPQSNRSLYNNMVIGTLAVDGWAVTCGTARRGLGRMQPSLYSPLLLYQM